MNRTHRVQQVQTPRPVREPLLALLIALAVVALAGCAGGGDPNRATRSSVPLASNEAELGVPSPAVEETAPARPRETPTRTVEESGGFKLASLSSASCTAEAPFDWTMQAPDRSDRADVFSPNGTSYAGYGIQAVNTALQGLASAYDPPLNDPDLYSDDPASVALAYGRIVVSALGGRPDLADVGEMVQPTAGYLLMPVASSTHRGVIFFRATGYPGDGYNYSYALPMYFAFTTSELWEREGPLIARVAASIRCSTQLQPPDDPPIVDPAPAGGDDSNGDDAGYNPQLGTEPVNDPTTGENFLVDPSTNWSETGPDGPGYYVPKGVNDYQKLEPGRAD